MDEKGPYSQGRVVGSILLVPQLDSSLRERGGHGRRGTVLVADRSAKTSVGYLTDTQLGEFRGHVSRSGGRIIFDSQRPARVRVSASVNQEGRPPRSLLRSVSQKDKPPKVRRFPPVTLGARSWQLPPTAASDGDAGVLAATLTCHGVRRMVNIPIAVTIEGAMLQGQGRFAVDLTDFGVAPPRLRGIEVQTDLTIEVCLLAVSQ